MKALLRDYLTTKKKFYEKYGIKLGYRQFIGIVEKKGLLENYMNGEYDDIIVNYTLD